MYAVKSSFRAVAVAAALAFAALPARADDIVDTAVKAGSFDTLVAAVNLLR